MYKIYSRCSFQTSALLIVLLILMSPSPVISGSNPAQTLNSILFGTGEKTEQVNKKEENLIEENINGKESESEIIFDSSQKSFPKMNLIMPVEDFIKNCSDKKNIKIQDTFKKMDTHVTKYEGLLAPMKAATRAMNKTDFESLLSAQLTQKKEIDQIVDQLNKNFRLLKDCSTFRHQAVVQGIYPMKNKDYITEKNIRKERQEPWLKDIILRSSIPDKLKESSMKMGTVEREIRNLRNEF
jgi:hypothetical protein